VQSYRRVHPVIFVSHILNWVFKTNYHDYRSRTHSSRKWGKPDEFPLSDEHKRLLFMNCLFLTRLTHRNLRSIGQHTTLRRWN